MIHSVDVNSNKGNINIKLNLTKDYRTAKLILNEELKKLHWVKNVKIDMAPREQTAADANAAKIAGLKDVKNIVAVSSCKGGVGKSTVAVNLAFSLRKQGFKVGIFDADLFGPSLPTMITTDQPHLVQDEHDPNKIAPVEFSGVKCMSYGFAGQKTAIMRGPMVSQLVI